MKLNKIIIIYTILLSALSCNTGDDSFGFEDLEDKRTYWEEIIIDCNQFKGRDIETLHINGTEVMPQSTYTLDESGYYHIEITYGKNLKKETIRIVIVDPERGEAEWGLKKWVPEDLIYDQWNSADLLVIGPKNAPEGINIPLIAVCGSMINREPFNLEASLLSHNFNIKKGIGSLNQVMDERANLSLSIGGSDFPVNIETIDISAIELNSRLLENTKIEANSYIHIGADLQIPEGITLTLEEGVFICVDPEINILNEGQIQFNGSALNPITVTCTEKDKFWGGIISKGANNSINAIHTIFCQSGFHDSEDYLWGHAGRQALFYVEDGILKLDHCYMIDHIGQVIFPKNAEVEIYNSLIQRVKTGGQANYSTLSINNSVFTDFPNDSDVYQDEDNDGLYIHACDAIITNSVFMFAKDDGLDSGGTSGGIIQVSNCIFESNFHEGAALSSKGEVIKTHVFKNCVFTNCGQGLELGFSSTNHHVDVDSCTFEENGIGIRWGDNYTMSHNGTISVSNSFSINNLSYDVWNMNRENWEADTAKMSFFNVYVSKTNPMYTDLKIYE